MFTGRYEQAPPHRMQKYPPQNMQPPSHMAPNHHQQQQQPNYTNYNSSGKYNCFFFIRMNYNKEKFAKTSCTGTKRNLT